MSSEPSSVKPPIPPLAQRLKGTLLMVAWALSIFALTAIALPSVNTRIQIKVSIVLVVLLLVLRPLASQTTARVLFVSVIWFIVSRYVLWRVFTTLEYHGPISFTVAIMVFMAEFYGVMIVAIGSFTNINPLKRPVHPLPDDPDELPTVDMLIPTYNEDMDILRPTLAACLNQDYPKDKFKVILCDDGGSDQKCSQSDEKKASEARARRKELKALCDEMGAHYLTRARNEHAKAGNLNEALKKTDGDLLGIFDADHLPTRDFLACTVGQFTKDEWCCVVQTPHYMINDDPIEKNLRFPQRMPREGAMFFHAIHEGLDFWNSSFFCGSAALIRRKAVESTGGFAGETIVEDAESGMTMHGVGWRTAYINRPLVSGLSAEDLTGFFIQRSRWLMGMLQLLRIKCPITRPGMSVAQRINYFNCCLFWFFPFPRLVFAMAPAALILFNLKIFSASLNGFLSYAIPYVAAMFIFSNFLYGRVRWFLTSEIYETVQCAQLFPSLLFTLFDPKGKGFQVTPKNVTMDEDRITRDSIPVCVLLGLNILVIIVGVIRLVQTPEAALSISVTLFWTLLNCVLLAGAVGAMLERSRPPGAPFVPVDMEGEFHYEDETYPLTLKEGSSVAGMIKINGIEPGILKPGTSARLHFPETDTGEVNFTVELPSDANKINAENMRVKFMPETTGGYRGMIDLVYGSSDRWVEHLAKRTKHKGIRTALIEVGWISFRGLCAFIFHAVKTSRATASNYNGVSVAAASSK